MSQTDVIQDYLHGKKFSNSAVIPLKNTDSPILYRDDYLLSLAKNKKILHLGFVDHLPLVDEKIAQDKWLHKKLMDVSTLCCGIDINKKGIEYIQNTYAYDNLFALDIINDIIPMEISQTQFDYLFIPDVIEHIGNPVAFLSALRERFKNVDSIIITTPNAFRLNNFINVFKNRELINSDHRFWFTPYTISKVMVDSGYEISSLGFFEHGTSSSKRIYKKLLLSKFHAFRDTLIAEAHFK